MAGADAQKGCQDRLSVFPYGDIRNTAFREKEVIKEQEQEESVVQIKPMQTRLSGRQPQKRPLGLTT